MSKTLFGGKGPQCLGVPARAHSAAMPRTAAADRPAQWGRAEGAEQGGNKMVFDHLDKLQWAAPARGAGVDRERRITALAF